jgi:deoxycytidine triphosphate deaminase
MEIYNMNDHESVVIPVGERIAQMVFYHTGPVEGEYQKLSGKYQSGSQTDLNKLVRRWRPEDMLPRAYKDERKEPLPL